MYSNINKFIDNSKSYYVLVEQILYILKESCSFLCLVKEMLLQKVSVFTKYFNLEHICEFN